MNINKITFLPYAPINSLHHVKLINFYCVALCRTLSVLESVETSLAYSNCVQLLDVHLKK